MFHFGDSAMAERSPESIELSHYARENDSFHSYMLKNEMEGSKGGRRDACNCICYQECDGMRCEKFVAF